MSMLLLQTGNHTYEYLIPSRSDPIHIGIMWGSFSPFVLPAGSSTTMLYLSTELPDISNNVGPVKSFLSIAEWTARGSRTDIQH
jgi:hypothetical protein